MISRPEDGYVFQIDEIVSSETPKIVIGLAFDTIKINDRLVLKNSNDKPAVMVVKEIEVLGKIRDYVDRGFGSQLKLDCECEISFGDERYLYLYKIGD